MARCGSELKVAKCCSHELNINLCTQSHLITRVGLVGYLPRVLSESRCNQSGTG